MIDEEGDRLYFQMIEAILAEENSISKEVSNAMAAFDGYMNRLNGTTGILYSKNGEVLMKC